MLRALFNALLRGARRSRGAQVVPTFRFRSTFESLEAREVPAVTASFSAGSGVLTVFGDNLDNTITMTRDAAGVIRVNGGAVAVVGGT